MSSLEVWATIIALGVSTVLTRSSFFVFSEVRLPERLLHGLRYAPAAALAAIVVPDLMVAGGQVSLTLANPKFLAGIAATLFFVATKRMLGTIVFGMLVFTLLRLFA
ncbi:MAG: AzlD domain-containing protein [Lacisediminimonas sp.]|nr:AzlD domain-containing protein [Lacisediminimonas sp.]